MASAQPVGRTGPWIARNPQHSAIGPGNFDNGFDTDKLRPYGVARRQVMPEVVHWSHKAPNDRAENSHRPGLRRIRSSSATPLIPLPGKQWSRGTPAQTLPVDHLDRHGLQTDIVEKPRI
jgi:hypothetical protein